MEKPPSMSKALVIVESPAKAKTINRYLGKDYTVKASLGHVKDLPKRELGVRVEDESFEPTYVVLPGKSKVLQEIEQAARAAEAIYLATDPDREGEAISEHLAEIITEALTRGNGGRRRRTPPKPIHRVLFHEITERAIREAFRNPGRINPHLVDAQQARRVLDRLVGYMVSPLLWDKVRRGLSAGRVQTVALRLIVEREREIRAFVPREYWTIHARLEGAEPPPIEAKLLRRDGEEIEIPDEAAARAILSELEGAVWKVASVQVREKRRHPPAPFTTSRLQQEAYNKLRFSAKRTMALAQQLYEGVELGPEGSVGLITYMRTDSVRVSDEALRQVREFIGQTYGAGLLPPRPNVFKSKKQAQEAHEAIRPTDVFRTPEQVRPYLDDDLYRLYRLIWQRFVASQMAPALYDQTTVDIAAGRYLFRATGSVLKFEGFLAVYQQPEDEDSDELRRLPRVVEGEELRLASLWPEQHFTEPPPRYTEATLVRELEEKGIGRPSTYATIISTLVEREYVRREQGRFFPTLLGEKVSDLLVRSFEEIFDVGFTARMEEELDEIEEGKLPWRESVREFYHRFMEALEQARGEMASYKAGIATEEICPRCGQGRLVERISRHGFFLGCERYPECDYTRDLGTGSSEEVESEAAAEYCPNCGREMVPKRGRFGPFLACSGYPSCRTTRRLSPTGRQAEASPVPLDEPCPQCGQPLVRRQGRYGEFIGCSAYPKCRYTRPVTLGIPCPKCRQGELVARRTRARGRTFYGCSRYPDCDYTLNHRPLPEPCPQCGAPFIVEKHSRRSRTRACEQCGWQAPVAETEPAPAAASGN
jgi:DNA topoisomerase-1